MRVILDNRRIAALRTLCEALGVSFSNIELLHQALTHTSFANECRNMGVIHNERLEFLGDAVLDLVISEYLFREFPNLPEGELTKSRSVVVCEGTLARRAAELNIGQYLLLGKGEASSGGRERASILADSFEAIIGAVYMDGGFRETSKFVLAQLKSALDMIGRGEGAKDYKTLLQEVVQKHNDSKIAYEIIDQRGPDHNKVFEVAVLINDVRSGTGVGKSKKEAEQHAAKQALVQLNILHEK
jgi:ribonuclease-3